MRTVLGFLEWSLMLVLFTHVSTFTQESQKEQEKKNPVIQNLEMESPQQDTNSSVPKGLQRQLPKFDLPEYIITGIASVDSQNVEKIPFEDVCNVLPTSVKSFKINQRDRETIEFAGKHPEDSRTEFKVYSGMVQAEIGSYFTPQVSLWFGQSLPNMQYTFGGMYYLTKGFAKNTDQSRGSFAATGRTYLAPNAPLDGALGYKSESFRFYGSEIPNLQRTISDFEINIGFENQARNNFPYMSGISICSENVSDSSSSSNETRIDLNFQTTLPVASLPLQMKFHGMTASGGLGFMDVSCGVQNYWYAGMLFEGSLHLYWAKGMAGQNLLRLRPQLMASYPFTTAHRLYVSYEPRIVPITMALNIRMNRYLSTVSTVRHADVTNAGEFGIESDWTETVRTRVSFGVKSIRDLTMFSDSTRPGVWTSAYGGQATIVTFSAEMVAKFKSNDYFAGNVMLRSTKDSFLEKRIPYFPSVEAGCRVRHGFGKAIVVNADARFVGEQQASFFGSSTVSSYATIDVSGDYTPLDFLKLSIGIINLTGARYEIWKGYREFPLTMQVAVQVKF
jgi:hypothetical protein